MVNLLFHFSFTITYISVSNLLFASLLPVWERAEDTKCTAVCLILCFLLNLCPWSDIIDRIWNLIVLIPDHC